MAENNVAEYPLGTNNVVYKAKGFQTGLTVTCFIWKPNMEKSDELSLTELEFGLYFFNFYFQDVGIYNAIFLENEEPSGA